MIRAGSRNAVIYHVYLRSFADSNADGIGDLDGVTARLEHIASLGADAVWLSPMFTSPQADMGYDVSNYRDIAPEYGDLAAMDRLIARSHELGLGVVLDIVPCHSSIEHPWFRDHPDWYIIRDGDAPPNNWRSTFGGAAWHHDPFGRGWYLHTFYPEQPNLNWRNPEVVAAMHDVLGFWFDRGVDGFRIDAIDKLFVDDDLRDEPVAGEPFPLFERAGYDELAHVHTSHQPEIFEVLEGFRRAFPGRYFVSEAYRPIDELTPYLERMDSSFCFEFTQAHLDVERIAAIVRATASMDGIGWMLSNPDHQRLIARWGTALARVAATLLLTLPGTAFIYQGDEIGMTDGPGADPPIDRVGRDPYRHPMQWRRDGGFTDGEPWLAMVNPGSCNVADQANDRDSMLTLYRTLIKLRRSLGSGATDVRAEGDVLRYRRGDHTIELNLGMTAVPRTARGEIIFSTCPVSSAGTIPAQCAVISHP